MDGDRFVAMRRQQLRSHLPSLLMDCEYSFLPALAANGNAASIVLRPSKRIKENAHSAAVKPRRGELRVRGAVFGFARPSHAIGRQGLIID